MPAVPLAPWRRAVWVGTCVTGMWNLSGLFPETPASATSYRAGMGSLRRQGFAGTSDAQASTGRGRRGGVFFFSITLFPVKKEKNFVLFEKALCMSFL